MGRIKTQQIKSKGEEIYSLHADLFTADFEHNKKKLMEIADIPSKKIRNILAGYLVKKVKKEK